MDVLIPASSAVVSEVEQGFTGLRKKSVLLKGTASAVPLSAAFALRLQQLRYRFYSLPHFFRSLFSRGKFAIAYRYPKASALGLSIAPRRGVLALPKARSAARRAKRPIYCRCSCLLIPGPCFSVK